MPSIADADIIQLLADDIAQAKQYQQELSPEREKFYKWYRAEPYGNERPGWAQTVHPTIFSVVEWMKPGLVEIFTGDFFALKPITQKGETPGQAQDRATRLKQYIRYKLFSQRDGEQAIEDWIHDCLVNHYGIFKVTQQDNWDIETVEVPQMTMEELQAAQAEDPNLIEAHVGGSMPSVDPATFATTTIYQDVTLVRKVQKYVGPVVEVVPASELYMLPGYPDLSKNPFVAHVVKRDLDHIYRQELAGIYRPGTTDLVRDKVDSRTTPLESDGEAQTQALVDNITSGILQHGVTQSSDPRKRNNGEVWIWECYTRLDMDGSGLLKPCIVTICEDVVLCDPVENPYGSAPFELGYIHKEPHKAIGRPVPAILDSRQRVMSNLLRGIQDSAAVSTYRGFLTTDARAKAALANMGPGDVAQVPSLGQGSIMPVDPGSPNEFIMEAFALTSQEVSKESGINENQQGLDANSLNKTAAAMEMRLTAGMQRQKLYARRLSRCVRRVMRRVLDILRKFPPSDDPTALGADIALQPGDVQGQYSVDIDVGVGPQDRVYYSQGMDQLVQFLVQIGLPMGIATPEHVVKAVKAKYEYLDMDVSEYLVAPEQAGSVASMTQQFQALQAENQALKQAIEEARYQDALKSEENRLKEQQQERDFVLKVRELFIKEKEVDARIAQAQAKALSDSLKVSAGCSCGGQCDGSCGGQCPECQAKAGGGHPPMMHQAPESMHGPGLAIPPLAGMLPGDADLLEQALLSQAMEDLAHVNQAPPVPQAPPINVVNGPNGPQATAPSAQNGPQASPAPQPQPNPQGQPQKAPQGPLPR